MKLSTITTLFLLFLGMFFLTSFAEAGTAHYDKERSVIVMQGSTDRVLRFQTLDLLRTHKKDVEYIEMSGPGGVMNDMVVIMRSIKDSGLPVIVPKGKVCASACAMAAISSKHLIVDGMVLFHMGYIGGYPQDTTLHQILNVGQAMTVDIAKDIANIGFKSNFLQHLIRYTGPDKWYVVTKARQLADCRRSEETIEDNYKSCYFSAPVMTTAEARYLLRASQGLSKEVTWPRVFNAQ